MCIVFRVNSFCLDTLTKNDLTNRQKGEIKVESKFLSDCTMQYDIGTLKTKRLKVPACHPEVLADINR